VDSQFELIVFPLESLINVLNSSFKFARDYKEGGASSLIGHLKLLQEYSAHLRKILKSKFG